MAESGYIVALCDKQPFVPNNAQPFDPQDKVETYATNSERQ